MCQKLLVVFQIVENIFFGWGVLKIVWFLVSSFVLFLFCMLCVFFCVFDYLVVVLLSFVTVVEVLKMIVFFSWK